MYYACDYLISEKEYDVLESPNEEDSLEFMQAKSK